MPKDRMVKVTWHDASSHVGWMDRKNAAVYSPYVCESIGFLLRNDRSAVVLSMNKNAQTNKFGDTIDIPRGMVRSIKTLR